MNNGYPGVGQTPLFAPRLRVELEHVKHGIQTMLTAHTEELQQMAEEALAELLVPEKIAERVRQEVEAQLRRVLDETIVTAIRSSVGDVVFERVREATLLAAKTEVERLSKRAKRGRQRR